MAGYQEGQRLQGSDGKIYVVRNGVPVVDAPTPNIMNPKLPFEVQQAQGQAAAAPYAAPKAQADAQIAQANAGVAGVVANAEAQKAQADAQKAAVELQKLKMEQSKVDPKSGAFLALQQQIDRVGELYRRDLQGGLPNSLNSVIPDMFQPKVDAFDSAAQGLVNPFMSAFKVQGQGSQSDTELRQFLEANTPAQGDADAVIEEKLANVQRRLDAERGITQSNQLPPDAAPNQQYGQATTMRDQVDPALKATGDRVATMLARGVSSDKILKFLEESGVDPSSTNIKEAFANRRTEEFKRWQRANPSAPYPLGPEFYTKKVPMSDARRLLNQGVQTGPGGVAAAGMAASANAISGGRLDNLSGNPEMTRTALMALRGAHPGASLAGDVAGQAGVEATLGRIPGARALMASQWGRRGADAAYGAYSGSGEMDGDAGTGALTGALTGLGLGMAGRSAQRGAGRVATGVRNPDLQYLHSRDVPMTIGQIARGSDNVIGHMAGGIEERMAGMPIADAIISSARRRGDEGFNAAAFREMGASGATGAQGIIEGQGLVNNAYNFLDGAQMPIDAQFAGSQAGVRAAIPGIPAFGPELTKSLNQMDAAAPNGILSGRAWQDALRSTKSNRASIRGKEFSDGAHNLLGDVETNLTDLAARQGPAGAVNDLKAANRLNAQFKTIAQALDNGPAQKADELFSVGRLDDAARTNTRKFGGQIASLSGYRPFYDLTKAGKAVMPNLTPDSGTAGRAVLYSGIAGSGIGGGAGLLAGDEGQKTGSGAEGAMWGLGIAGLMAAPYSKTGQKLLQNALLGKRKQSVERIGEYLIQHPRLAGMFASSIGRDVMYQPELP